MNLAPTTAKQLALYDAFNRHGVKWILVGALAYYFNGRYRGTMDIDFLLEPSKRNMRNVTTAMLQLGYNMGGSNDYSLRDHPRLRVVNAAIVDLHSVFCKTRYEEVDYYVDEYEGIKINVATRESCVMMLHRETKYPADLKVLELMEDMHGNWEEICKYQ